MIKSDNNPSYPTKAIWIIGASKGIGAALVCAIDAPDTLIFTSARKLIRAEDPDARSQATIIPIELDVCDAASVERAVQRIGQYTDHLEQVIISAGTCEYIDSRSIDFAAIKRVMDTNFWGALKVIDAALPFLRSALKHSDAPAHGAPQLVILSSSVTYQALPRAGAYGASKAALRYFIEALKLDLQHEGIDVRLVSPGFVQTPLTEQNDFPMPFSMSAEEAAKRIVKGLASKRFDIHFPKRFTCTLKMLALLPDALRFKLIGKLSRHPVATMATSTQTPNI